MITIGARTAARGCAAGARWVAVLGLAAVVVACSSPPTAAPPSSIVAPSSTAVSERVTTTPKPTTTAQPAGQLPGDLTPNVVEDECLLTADEFGTLAGRGAIRAENTELAGGAGRRSCFYTPNAAVDPAARVDVYASASLPPPELVTRIAANGGRSLPGVGKGAVVVTGQDGTSELVVASASLLAVLTLLPGGAAIPPSDQSWTAAGTAMAARLPQ